MATIHVNTDVMRHLGQLFVNLSHEIWDNIRPQIENGIHQLEADWQGVSRQRFEQLFAEWRHHAHQLTDLGYQIGQHLERTADAFDQADQSS